MDGNVPMSETGGRTDTLPNEESGKIGNEEINKNCRNEVIARALDESFDNKISEFRPKSLNSSDSEKVDDYELLNQIPIEDSRSVVESELDSFPGVAETQTESSELNKNCELMNVPVEGEEIEKNPREPMDVESEIPTGAEENTEEAIDLDASEEGRTGDDQSFGGKSVETEERQETENSGADGEFQESSRTDSEPAPTGHEDSSEKNGTVVELLSSPPNQREKETASEAEATSESTSAWQEVGSETVAAQEMDSAPATEASNSAPAWHELVASSSSQQNDDSRPSRAKSVGEGSEASDDDVELISPAQKETRQPMLVMSTSLMPLEENVPVSSAADSVISIVPDDSEETFDPVTTPSKKSRESLPIPSSCAQCKEVKQCGIRLGKIVLCSEECRVAKTNEDAKLLAQRVCKQCCCKLTVSKYKWGCSDFCCVICLAQHQSTVGVACVECTSNVKPAYLGKFCVRFGSSLKQFCGPMCLCAHKRKMKICSYCHTDMQNIVSNLAKFSNHRFCSMLCMKNHEQKMNNDVPIPCACAVCSKVQPVSVKVMQGTKLNSICSEVCFSAFKFVNNLSEGRCGQCDAFYDKSLWEKIIIYDDDRPIQLCSVPCRNIYLMENQFKVECACCKVRKYNFDMIQKNEGPQPVFTCSLMCLKEFESSTITCRSCGISSKPHLQVSLPSGVADVCSDKCCKALQDSAVMAPPKIYQSIITKPPEPITVKNKTILCKPFMHNKGTFCRPMPCHKECQTDESLNPKMVVPIPVPIFVPTPLRMYSNPYPVPLPFPLAIPVPIFIPTTRNSAKGIMKEIKKIHDKMPADPFEAELLMMAEMVAGDKKLDQTDSESEGEPNDTFEENDVKDTYSPEQVDHSNSFGDDIMQMALFASDLAEPQVDMESVLTSNTITPSQQATVDTKALYDDNVENESPHLALRGRKRQTRSSRGGSQPSKRGRRSTTPADHNMHHGMANMAHNMQPPEPQRIEVEKPDANMRLKYTFGVNAWRHWVMQKNQELEKLMVTNRKVKPFKPDLLQLTADELNFSLCLFVKEVKKPNGQEYAPDTIYYLCLGIQQYLFENGRIDNIFTDIYYEKFTDCLDEVAKKFAVIYNDSQYIVTRVEEEHLWESKQLGAHSPHVLLSTLMFFNTKHFNLVTVEEHMQLSFSHIMKHWKRNPNSPGVAKVPGARNVLLRFYPPQSALEANSRKKKVYEQQENEENPLRCPVKLYEFYLSKCPESVKTRNDVFYLLPERSCVPDSPVWYSTMALSKEPLMKMLHRVKMVKEINVALLQT